MASALAADLCAASIATAQLYGMACNLQGTIMLLLYQQGYTKVISHMCCTPPSKWTQELYLTAMLAASTNASCVNSSRTHVL